MNFENVYDEHVPTVQFRDHYTREVSVVLPGPGISLERNQALTVCVKCVFIAFLHV